MSKQVGAASSVHSDALLAASRLLEEITGSCPADAYDWHRPPMDVCETNCHQGCETECWAMYAEWLAVNAVVGGEVTP